MREELPHTTKLIIAQRISSVQEANMIIVLDNGAISAVGTHAVSYTHLDVYKRQVQAVSVLMVPLEGRGSPVGVSVYGTCGHAHRENCGIGRAGRRQRMSLLGRIKVKLFQVQAIGNVL